MSFTKKIIFAAALVFTIPLTLSTVVAQQLEDLQAINAKSKSQFIKAEELDQLMIRLRPFVKSPDAKTDTLLLETFQSISKSYVMNNHYRQAYEVYRRYINYKEGMLAKDKKSSIASVVNSVSTREGNEVNEENQLKSQLTELQATNAGLSGRRSSFKTYFSFILIFLSSIFAIMLVSSGIRIVSLRSQLAQTRQKMKEIHRKAVTGNFDTGLRESVNSSLTSIQSVAVELKEQLETVGSEIPDSKTPLSIIKGIEQNLAQG